MRLPGTRRNRRINHRRSRQSLNRTRSNQGTIRHRRRVHHPSNSRRSRRQHRRPPSYRRHSRLHTLRLLKRQRRPYRRPSSRILLMLLVNILAIHNRSRDNRSRRRPGSMGRPQRQYSSHHPRHSRSPTRRRHSSSTPRRRMLLRVPQSMRTHRSRRRSRRVIRTRKMLHRPPYRRLGASINTRLPTRRRSRHSHTTSRRTRPARRLQHLQSIQPASSSPRISHRRSRRASSNNDPRPPKSNRRHTSYVPQDSFFGSTASSQCQTTASGYDSSTTLYVTYIDYSVESIESYTNVSTGRTT